MITCKNEYKYRDINLCILRLQNYLHGLRRVS